MSGFTPLYILLVIVLTQYKQMFLRDAYTTFYQHPRVLPKKKWRCKHVDKKSALLPKGFESSSWSHNIVMNETAHSPSLREHKRHELRVRISFQNHYVTTRVNQHPKTAHLIDISSATLRVQLALTCLPQHHPQITLHFLFRTPHRWKEDEHANLWTAKNVTRNCASWWEAF